MLRLIFTACHPLLSAEARVALTLRLLGGLTTREIARAYLVSEATVAQRIVRAKRTLAAAEVPFEVPGHNELPGRLGSVLEVVYLIFNEGYAASAGEEWIRPELIEEALRLGRILSGLLPAEPEVHGLAALMELQASRSGARTGPSGEAIPLDEQDRSSWDWVLIGRGKAALAARAGHGADRPLRAAGGDRRLPRRRPDAGGHGLGADRRALRRPRPAHPLPRDRAEPGGRGRPGLRSAGRRSTSSTACRGALDVRLPPAAGGEGRPARAARAPHEAREEFERAAALTRNSRERDVLLGRVSELAGRPA